MAMTLYHIRAPNQEPVIAHVCLGLAQLAYMSQSAAYLVIFKHLWQHDKTIAAALLPETALRTRRRRNAFDLTGQLTFMLLTCCTMTSILLGTYWMSSNKRLWTFMLYKSTYGIYGLCHLVSSPPLRIELVASLKTLGRYVSLPAIGLRDWLRKISRVLSILGFY